MQKEYYVHSNEEQHGPFSIDEIVEKLSAGEYDLTDYVYDDAKQDWVMMLEVDAISQKVKGSDRSANSKIEDSDTAPFGEKTYVGEAKTTPSASDEKSEEWYVLKWDNRYGPFSLVEMVKMLQEKSIFEFDYIWKSEMQTWKRLAEVEQFAPESMRKLKGLEVAEISEVFFRRRHMRTDYNGSIIFHDNQKVWKGDSLEISEGGAGVVMHNAMVLPGQTVYMHFKPGDGVPPFNAVVEVISKKYVKGIKDRNTPLSYGVKFVSIDEDAKEAIRGFIERGEAA